MSTTTTKLQLIQEVAELYHSKTDRYLSSTQLTRFRRSPQVYHYHRIGLMSEPARDAYFFGEAFHCMVLEAERFNDEYLVADGPINEKTQQPYGTQTKAFRAWAAAQTRPVISTDDYAAMSKMAANVQQHERTGMLMAHGVAEHVIRAEWMGRACQIRCDWLDTDGGLIVDLKTTRGLDSFLASAAKFGYVHQLAFYRDVANAAGADVDLVAIVASEKCEPYRCGLFRPSDQALERASRENAVAVAELLECERSNVWPSRYEEPILIELE